MNYLAHAVLSYNIPDLLFGNMIADFVKGTESYEKYEPSIQKGIDLHRMIDAYTDAHPAMLRIRNIFRPDYRLYSGAIVDVVMDYYLANDPQLFNSQQHLLDFTLDVYGKMDAMIDKMPDTYRHMYHYLKKDNWLYDIRTLKGLERALIRLQRKANYMQDSHQSFSLAVQHYYELNQAYYELIHDLEKIVKDWIDKNI